MSKFHQKIYDQHYTGTLPVDGQSLSDFVLPTGLFRTKDIIYTLTNSSQEWKDKYKIDLVTQNNDIKVITGEFMRTDLVKYSTKYHRMVQDLIINLKHDQGKVIITHTYVKILGVLFISEILRKNGFIDEFSTPVDQTLCAICGISRIKHELKKHEYFPARFVLIHGELDKAVINQSIDKFNHPNNLHGYYYRVLIGSKMMGEGMNFKAVQNLFIMGVPANFSTLIQIRGRPRRAGSHIDLPPEKQFVRERIYVTSLSNDENEFSYEEKKYFEKSQDYLIIQLIDKIFNESAIDAIIHRDIIMSEKSKQMEADLGSLYYTPSLEMFGQKWMNISTGKDITSKDLDTSSWEIFYQDDEIETIIYIIKRLFIEQSFVFTYDLLWQMVQEPPFEVQVNSKLFSEFSFVIALNSLSDTKDVDVYSFYTKTKSQLDNLFDKYDKKIMIGSKECQIVQIDDYYILFPLVMLGDEAQKRPIYQLGTNIENIVGLPDIDLDSWYQHAEEIENTSFYLTKSFKTQETSYGQMKYNFYNKFKDIPVVEMPITTELYSMEFHIKLIEDSIKYVFNILTNPDFTFSELHTFYFKMLYFYDRLDLILFASDLLTIPKFKQIYEPFITTSKLEMGFRSLVQNKKTFLKPDHQYNAFLMSSIEKNSEPSQFNLTRMNEYIGKSKNRSSMSRKRINKVFSSMLPVGHFLTEETTLVLVPSVFLPDGSWIKVPEFVGQFDTNTIIENDQLIGYYEPGGLEHKFKIRNPIHKIELHEDTRMIERGSACDTKKKHQLVALVKQLNLPYIPNNNIKKTCQQIKLELMKRELNARRKYRHELNAGKDVKQIKWFYLHFEPQPSTKPR